VAVFFEQPILSQPIQCDRVYKARVASKRLGDHFNVVVGRV
jgi:hypothetical protein